MNYLSARFLVAVAECAIEQKNEQLLRDAVEMLLEVIEGKERMAEDRRARTLRNGFRILLPGKAADSE
jgi:hypothetical protein